MKTVLTIAGSDCSGGAGVQADIKTITAHKIYAASVITALTAQNTQKVFEVTEMSPEFVGKQLDAVFTDIYTDAIKIGMMASADIIQVIADKLTSYKPTNIVLDPVMIASSGRKLLCDEAIETLKNKLMPKVDLITPNIKEAEVLSGIQVRSTIDMIKAAEKISAYFKGNILIKGGHLMGSADDLLYSSGESIWFKGTRIGNTDRHGTGCTLSSAIACNLANNLTLKNAVRSAKSYVRGALATDTHLGQGCSPLDHSYAIVSSFEE
ncbi:MAG: bifunctional hydroxymethylpyrimidine kinase/phosphomethylpyrimidine kinase [Clostridia bacterium]|nr:bifunctional hydroxymethylpyrimidine kinase/phosphomethylpyrimidine kinase [Clostridia bacterium]